MGKTRKRHGKTVAVPKQNPVRVFISPGDLPSGARWDSNVVIL
jgi:hypothetical protein